MRKQSQLSLIGSVLRSSLAPTQEYELTTMKPLTRLGYKGPQVTRIQPDGNVWKTFSNFCYIIFFNSILKQFGGIRNYLFNI